MLQISAGSRNKLLSFLLILILLVTMIPASVFADTQEESVTVWFYCENPQDFTINATTRTTLDKAITLPPEVVVPMQQVTVTAGEAASINEEMHDVYNYTVTAEGITAAHVLIKALQNCGKDPWSSTVLQWKSDETLGGFDGTLDTLEGKSVTGTAVSGTFINNSGNTSGVCGISSELFSIAGEVPTPETVENNPWMLPVTGGTKILRMSKFSIIGATAAATSTDNLVKYGFITNTTDSTYSISILSGVEQSMQLKPQARNSIPDGGGNFSIYPTTSFTSGKTRLAVYTVSNGNFTDVTGSSYFSISSGATAVVPYCTVTSSASTPPGVYYIKLIYNFVNTLTSPSDYIIVNVGSGGSSVDKSALQSAIDSVPTEGFYMENDRWNGKETSVKGFWADFQAVLSAAKTVNGNATATKEQVDAAVAALTKAESRLIPTSQINATSLYEAVNSEKVRDGTLYTPVTWNDLQSAVSTAESVLDSLYDEYGTATEINLSSNVDTLDAITDAIGEMQTKEAGLYLSSMYEYAEKTVKATRTILPALLSQINGSNLLERDYTGESWSAFQAALAAGRECSIPVLTGMSGDREAADAYAGVFDDLYQAYYWGLVPTGSISVRLQCMDPTYARYEKNHGDFPAPITSSGAGYSGTVTLAAGRSTLKDALEAAGAGSGTEWDKVAVYINGVFVTGCYGIDDNSIDKYGQLSGLVLHPEDRVTVIWNLLPLSRQSPTIGTVQALFSQYRDSLKTARFKQQDGIEAEAGLEFNLSVEATAAYLGGYTGDYSPAGNMTLYISEAAADGTGNQPALTKLQSDGTDITTGTGGQAGITLYNEGWYIITAYDLENDSLGDRPQWGDTTVKAGSYHSVNSGAVIRVHVTESSDRNKVKSNLKADLDKAYNAYDESYFRPSDWAGILDAYNSAAAGIAAAETVGAARNAQQTGIIAIKRIQAGMITENTNNLAGFRNVLDRLPDDTNLLSASVQALVTGLATRYKLMSDYQKSRLTSMELAKYDRIIAADENGLPATVAYSLTLKVKVDNVDAATAMAGTTAAAIQGMIGYLQSSNTNRENPDSADIATLAGKTEKWRINQFFKYQRTDSGSTSITPDLNTSGSDPDYRVKLAVDPGFYAYSLVRQDPDHAISGENWSISDENFTFSDYNKSGTYYYYDVLKNMAVKINGVEYEIKSIDYEGIDSSEVSMEFSDLIDRTDYHGKSPENVNVWFPDSMLSFIMPYNNVTVTLNWGPVSTSSDLTAAKDSAEKAIEATYAAYDLDKYDESGKNLLLQAKTKALSDIAAATTIDGITAARKAALTAMASVARMSSGGPGVVLPDYGSAAGQVFVSIENTTYPGGDFTGTILSGWYPLYARDTMMSVVLKALAAEGFSWTGTGGTHGNTDDYTISYLASISKGGRSVGEFSGEAGSGWMGTLNDWFVNEGFQSFGVSSSGNYKLENGDELRIAFTQNKGEDLGGTWGNSDTRLQKLEISGGELLSAFSGDITGYGLIISGSTSNLKVTPTAVNKNYLSKTFLNTYNSDSAFYKRTEMIPVKTGDTLYIGVGDKSWPSMNKQGDESRDYTGTRYMAKVYDSKGIYLKDAIAALPAEAKTSLSNQQEVERLRRLYTSLDSTEKGKVTNLIVLEAAESRVRFFVGIRNVKELLAAIPATSRITLADKTAVLQADSAYKALTDEQKLYITVGDVANYNAAIVKLTALGAFNSGSIPSTITGSDGVPEEEKATAAITPKLTMSNGTASGTVAQQEMEDAIAYAGKNKIDSITIYIDTDEDIDRANVTVNTTAIRDMADYSDMALVVDTPVGTIRIPNKVLSSIVSQAGSSDVKFSVETKSSEVVKPSGVDTANATVVEITVAAGGKNITKFDDGSLVVSIPVDSSRYKAGESCKVIVISADGKMETMVGKVVVREGRYFVDLAVKHLSMFIVTGERTPAYIDVAVGSWYYDAVQYATLNGLMDDTGDNRFNPEANMSRALLVTILYRQEGSPAVAGSSPFTDVKAGQWYTDAVNWASKTGIIAGYGDNRFGITDNVTRFQLASILYRYARYKGYDVSKTTEISHYTDASAIIDWALPAMRWANAEGLITGTGTTALAPAGIATRAQIAAILMRFDTNIVK